MKHFLPLFLSSIACFTSSVLATTTVEMKSITELEMEVSANPDIGFCIEVSEFQHIVQWSPVNIDPGQTATIPFEIKNAPVGYVPTCGYIDYLGFAPESNLSLSLFAPSMGSEERAYEAKIPSTRLSLSDLVIGAGPGDDLIDGIWYLDITNHGEEMVTVEEGQLRIFSRAD